MRPPDSSRAPGVPTDGGVRRVRFDDLPAAVRRRFVACADGREDPRPILATTLEARGGVYATLAVAAGIVLGSLLWFGWGIDPNAERLGSAAWVTAKYAAMTMIFTTMTFVALRARARERAVPWRPGRYLFPAAFIDATTAELRVLPLTGLRAQRELALRDGSGMVELRFDGDALEWLSRKPGDEPLAVTSAKELRRRLEDALRSESQAALAKLDPLVLADEDAEVVVGGYRAAAKRVAKQVDGPRSRPTSRWLERPFALGALVTLGLSAALGLFGLPALALARARQSHSPGALRRVAQAWPYGWVQRAAGIRFPSVDEVAQDLGRRLRDPDGRVAQAILPFIREAKRTGDPRVVAYFQLARIESPTLSAVQMTAAQARRVGVSFQRALGLPPELLMVESRGRLPSSPERNHVVFRCSVEESQRAYPSNGQSFQGIALTCESWFVSGETSERVARVTVEPSATLDLDDKLAKREEESPELLGEDAGAEPISLAGVEATAYRAMMESAIDGLTAAFEADLFR